jgi:hypothetical protein
MEQRELARMAAFFLEDAAARTMSLARAMKSCALRDRLVQLAAVLAENVRVVAAEAE